jgi:hypothetical protein
MGGKKDGNVIKNEDEDDNDYWKPHGGKWKEFENRK